MKANQLLLASLICLSNLGLSNLAVAANFKLEASGSEPLYQSTLPKAVYQYSKNENLQDLAIINASGEQVPYALLQYQELHPQSVTTQDTKALTFFPLKESSLNNPGELTVQIDKIANDSTTVNISTKSFNITPHDKSTSGKNIYLVDAGKKHAPLQTISVNWQGSADVLLSLDVLASDDLKNWSTIGHGVLLKTSAEGKALRQDTVNFDSATEARYLQIRGTDNATFYVSGINAIYSNTRSVTPALLWQELQFSTRENDSKNGLVNLDFESLGRLPASHLRVHLPQNNTITSANILVRNKSDAPWQILSTSSLYRMDKAGKTYTSPDIVLSSSYGQAWRFWRLQFNQANGGIGTENPSLSLGWLPQTVVWNARGQAPFHLQVGENQNISNTVAIESLIPDYKIEKVLQLPVANIVQTQDAAPATSNWTSAPDYKTWALWGGLFLGVLLLAGMAYSLVKSGK